MTTTGAKGFRLTFGSTKEILAVVISVVSFLISMVSAYINNLKAPDLSFITAPYFKHVVDNSSRNEAFFIPLTMINRGARPGTLLSFELIVTHLPSGKEQVYYGQYFTQDNSQTEIGGFFAPITLNGYSSLSRTLCFYPLGQRQETFFSQAGEYQFRVVGQTANVRQDAAKTTESAFTVTVDEEMLTEMQRAPDGEYPFSIPTRP